jgi:hypothetical protein
MKRFLFQNQEVQAPMGKSQQTGLHGPCPLHIGSIDRKAGGSAVDYRVVERNLPPGHL